MDDTAVSVEQPPELEKVRRHVRILVDLARAAGETDDQNRFLDQAVVQVARAVEIGHVKVLKYRRRERICWLLPVSDGRKASSARRRCRLI